MRQIDHKPRSIIREGALPEDAARRRQIRQFARHIAEQFRPDRIILFGSHAYGAPHADSDVDLLVVMPTRNPIGQAVKIRLALPAPFPLDLLVRSQEMLAKRIEQEDWFLSEIVSKGKVLYEKDNGSVGEKRPKPTSNWPAQSFAAASLSMTLSAFIASSLPRNT